MNWRNTWILVGVAVALFAFIMLFERRVTTSDRVEPPRTILAGFKPAASTSLQLRRGTQFVINLERTNGTWRYTKPFNYAASTLAVGQFLEALDQLLPATYITPGAILSRKQTSADFGFDAPPIVIAMQAGGDRQELRFGTRTPAGDQVYLEVAGKAGVYVVAAGILDGLPRTQHDWRDTGLFSLPGAKLDRCEITRPGGGFALQRDLTNNLWRLTRPAQRADQLKTEFLLKRIADLRIAGFVSDDPRVDPDAYGLQNPAAEITLGTAAQIQKIQIGRILTNDPALLYARQVNDTNVILVSRDVIDLIATPYTELRDRRLVAFAPEGIDTIEVRSGEPFVAKRGANGWSVAEVPVDSAFVTNLLVSLAELQVREFEKDVVTDFTPFALAPPKRSLILRTTVTNAAGVTNVPVVLLDFGTNKTPDTVFVRRGDEDSVYTIHALDALHIPEAAWQLRDHRVWKFATNQVVRVTAKQGGRSRQFIRQPSGEWISTGGDVNGYALEEVMFRLGELHATAWVGRGDMAKAVRRFGPGGYQLEVEVKEAETNRVFALEFGGPNPLRLPYAATSVDGQPWVFEFPWALFAELVRHLSVPPDGGL
jgi:hypothetical protein